MTALLCFAAVVLLVVLCACASSSAAGRVADRWDDETGGGRR